MISGGTSLSQQCSCTWVMQGWSPGNVKSGINGTNAAWEAPSPPAPPWHRHRTRPAADTIHQELHNWFVWWSFGSYTNCWFFYFFFNGKKSARGEMQMKEATAGKRFGKWLRANKTETVQKEWLQSGGRLQQIQLAASRKGFHRSCRVNLSIFEYLIQENHRGKLFNNVMFEVSERRIPTLWILLLHLFSCHFYLLKPLELLILSHIATTLAQ